MLTGSAFAQASLQGFPPHCEKHATFRGHRVDEQKSGHVGSVQIGFVLPVQTKLHLSFIGQSCGSQKLWNAPCELKASTAAQAELHGSPPHAVVQARARGQSIALQAVAQPGVQGFPLQVLLHVAFCGQRVALQ